ncbi:MAG: GNAT family N-acetyltransferase [Gemmatimonadaceae bacterium]|nr:GNAT family N-acetyltransferase [Gemmatimonadaceae bacterium]
MIRIAPITLEGYGLRLEPLAPAHAAGLAAATRDGSLWEIHYTSVPAPDGVDAYIADALRGFEAGLMLPWAVRELTTDSIIGSTRYHDIVAAIDRVEIGYTWYAARWQRTHVNTAAKLLLMAHAFDALGCAVVGWRTDLLNTRSQAAIARLGAQRDGVLRHHQTRRDGSARDTVMFSLLREEWPAARARLEAKLAAHS